MYLVGLGQVNLSLLRSDFLVLLGMGRVLVKKIPDNFLGLSRYRVGQNSLVSGIVYIVLVKNFARALGYSGRVGQNILALGFDLT